MRTSIYFLWLWCVACGGEGEGGLAVIARGPEVLRASSAEDCPNWTFAPAGDQWNGRFYCDPCGRVWAGATVGGDIDPTIYWLQDFSLYCECITETFQYNTGCLDKSSAASIGPSPSSEPTP